MSGILPVRAQRPDHSCHGEHDDQAFEHTGQEERMYRRPRCRGGLDCQELRSQADGARRGARVPDKRMRQLPHMHRQDALKLGETEERMLLLNAWQ